MVRLVSGVITGVAFGANGESCPVSGEFEAVIRLAVSRLGVVDYIWAVDGDKKVPVYIRETN